MVKEAAAAPRNIPTRRTRRSAESKPEEDKKVRHYLQLENVLLLF